jgi:hypothetical protein
MWVITEWVLLCLAPTAALYAALHLGRIGRWVQRPFRRLRHKPATPAGPPIERIVADLHRIAGLIEALPPRAPLARRQGAILAYDDALGSACRALGVDDALRGLPFGSRRDAVRVHVEAELACAGLVLAPPRAA